MKQLQKILFAAYGVTSYMLSMVAFVYLMGFVIGMFVPKHIDNGVETPLLMALAINLFWLLIFGVQHTIMARPGFKQWWHKIVPQPIERSTYVLISTLLTFGLFWQWRPIDTVVWDFSGSAIGTAMLALYVLGWGILLASTFIIDHFDLLGLKQVYFNFVDRKLKPPGFQVKLLYRLCRHPIMLGWIVLFWATPMMSAGHLLFAAVWSGYILIALIFEERDLVGLHGDKYKRYQRDVPKLVPFMRLKATPKSARIYLLAAALLIAFSTMAGMYKGHEGKFLVATGALAGTDFEEAVIYLGRHDFWGAHGVIINRPVRKATVEHDFPEKKWRVQLYKGGPVAAGENNSLLLKAEDMPNGFLVTSMEDVRKTSPDFVKDLEGWKNKHPLRLFMGYSGWGIWQLNREIGRGAWAVIDYDETLMFKTSSKRAWKKAMERVLESRPAEGAGV